MAKSLRGARAVKEWVMKLHTGETLFSATPNWTWEQRQQLGQEYLAYLAEDILQYHSRLGGYSKQAYGAAVGKLKSQLELDGYQWADDRLLLSEATVIDIAEVVGVLHRLIQGLDLSNAKATIHFLELSEEHYVEKRWSDSIANSRKFLESVLQEIAGSHFRRKNLAELSADIYSKPVLVRDYLEQEGLLETKEKETVAKVYGLLSHTGGHPYMADADQARLLRHLSLTIGQFALLRYKGSLSP
ncbi:MAG: hypothetical protein DLM73_09730 [Chthoniobacterales bacterium]|nr:MAG: hypothetical protein DLM73_09730 [Chthoniobacterales bacterium]